MQHQLETVRKKVFRHPVTGKDYGPIRIPAKPGQFETLDGKSFEVLAEDVCGNFFTITPDGAVWFWDHETDDLEPLVGSVAEFVANCIVPEPVEFDPKQVKSAWIDPAFAKSLGMKVPADGWVKKKSKPKWWQFR